MELTELFEERTALPRAGVGHEERMAGIRRKVISRRRRLSAGAVTLVVLALGGAGGVALVDEERATEPADLAGFPEYHAGRRIAAAASGPLAERLELTFVPQTAEVRVFWRCEAAAALGDTFNLSGVRFWLDDEPLAYAGGQLPCDGEIVGKPFSFDSEVRPGRSHTIAVTVAEGPLSADATFAVAVGEPVPFEEYPLPPRPEPLPELDLPSEECDFLLRLHSDPVDPNRPAEVMLPLDTHHIYVYAQTPGLVNIAVDGIPAARAEVWAYDGFDQAHLDVDELRAAGLTVPRRQEVQLTVTPEHMTGEWLLVIHESDYCW